MKEILTTEEIDTLLDMFRAEEADLDPGDVEDFATQSAVGEDEPVVSPVDLLKPNRFNRAQLQALERICAAAAKSISATISDKLRTEINCDCVAVEQIRYGSWISQVGGPVGIYELAMAPFETPVLFSVTTGLLYSAVDRILGGSGNMQQVVTEFTAAEYTVADAFVGPCLESIVDSFEEVVPLNWSVENRYCNSSMAQIVADHDVVLSIYFQASGEQLLGDLRMVIPYSAFEPFLEPLTKGNDSGFKQEPGSMRETVAKTMNRVPVELSVCLGTADLRLRELMELRQGDVIPLSTRIGEPLIVPVQGVPKFAGQIGTRGSRLAFRVGDVLETVG